MIGAAATLVINGKQAMSPGQVSMAPHPSQQQLFEETLQVADVLIATPRIQSKKRHKTRSISEFILFRGLIDNFAVSK
jgi:hypothetical protein